MKTLYISLLTATIAVFALFEFGALPVDAVPYSPSAAYVLNLLSIITSVGGCFALLYCFRFKHIAARLAAPDGERFLQRLLRWRLWVWFVLMLLNIAIYYEGRFATNARYGILVLAAAFVFCYGRPPKGPENKE